MATNITDLPVDVFDRIISKVAALPDGAREFVKSMSTCQRFLKASDSIIVLRAVCFKKVKVLYQCRLFQRRNGLLVKCAKAGNPSATIRLAQVILATSTQLVDAHISKARLHHFRGYSPKYKHGRKKARDDPAVASFMASFIPSPGSYPTPPSFHWQFVKAFILNCSPSGIRPMNRHLDSYVELFAGRDFRRFKFLNLVHMLVRISTIKRNTLLVRAYDDYFVMFESKGFVSPPHREVIDWRGAGALFENIRAKAVDALDAIYPSLCSC